MAPTLEAANGVCLSCTGYNKDGISWDQVAKANAAKQQALTGMADASNKEKAFKSAADEMQRKLEEREKDKDPKNDPTQEEADQLAFLRQKQAESKLSKETFAQNAGVNADAADGLSDSGSCPTCGKGGGGGGSGGSGGGSDDAMSKMMMAQALSKAGQSASDSSKDKDKNSGGSSSQSTQTASNSSNNNSSASQGASNSAIASAPSDANTGISPDILAKLSPPTGDGSTSPTGTGSTGSTAQTDYAENAAALTAQLNGASQAQAAELANLSDALNGKTTLNPINSTAQTQSTANTSTAGTGTPAMGLGGAMNAIPTPNSGMQVAANQAGVSRVDAIGTPGGTTTVRGMTSATAAGSSSGGEESTAKSGFELPSFGAPAQDSAGGDFGSIVHASVGGTGLGISRGISSTRQLGKVSDPDAPAIPSSLATVMQGQRLVQGSHRPL
ncbi:hypothetical protein K2X33_11690 [bacterium]|nr:hypothetical protein [bacterium]